MTKNTDPAGLSSSPKPPSVQYRIERPVPTEHCLSTAHHAAHEWGDHDNQPGTGYWCRGFDASDELPSLPTREPTVQVPVSLIEDVRAALGFHVGEQDRLYLVVDALLSQPTMIAKPDRWSDGWSDGWKEAVAYFQVDAEAFHARNAAAPPSIEDMTPGTHTYIEGRFGDDGVCHAHTPGQTNYSAWPGRCYRPRADRVHIDPSTIRDVTPPTNG